MFIRIQVKWSWWPVHIKLCVFKQDSTVQSITAYQLAPNFAASTGKTIWLSVCKLFALVYMQICCIQSYPWHSFHWRSRIEEKLLKLDLRSPKLDITAMAIVILISDSGFCLQTFSRILLIWRETGNRHQASNICELQTCRGGGLRIWSEIAVRGSTNFHIFSRGTMTAVRQRDDILVPYVELFLSVMVLDYVFMDENIRVHRARNVNQ